MKKVLYFALLISDEVLETDHVSVSTVAGRKYLLPINTIDIDDYTTLRLTSLVDQSLELITNGEEN